MRKLKLQMQISTDGFVAGLNGEWDWVTMPDEKIAAFVNVHLMDFDTILLGRKMTDGFVGHWASVMNNPESPQFQQAKKFVGTPKIVFSKTLTESLWANTELATGELSAEVNRLKNLPGKDIIVYGGAGFVTSLIEARLIDELYLSVNPVALGEGLRIFSGRTPLRLVASTAFENGKVVNQYVFK